MKRVFSLDALHCPCGAPCRMLAVLTRPEAILAILRGLGPSESVPARGSPPPGSLSTFPIHNHGSG
jgi:hypothetical protein